ncbi:transposase [Paenibacillus crassostreae]|uniref:Transposase n=1 Tax=Paenibacillus crassostreae TaxID=1763538 RepID=A0A167FJJ8_9BACL|nr:transposase [Paenibacillus crassostreae]AOZ94336.1 transposase [Paenibacillus crassostreae]OAB76626.1 transposase [Paenibacillus crassostreae]
MNNENRKRYTQEFKDAVLVRMMPPNNESIKSISDELGISEQSLYKWRQKARTDGNATPGNGQTAERWSSEDKFLVVMESYSMNQSELAEYCRKKGLYKEQIDAWRSVCLNANTGEINQTKRLSQELKEERRRTSEIEKDLRKKEKALAEAAALLLLRKKARAIWGDQEDE